MRISAMKSNFENKNITFQGALKTNLRIGESVLRQFNAEFPFLKSNTALISKYYRESDSRFWLFSLTDEHRKNFRKLLKKYNHSVMMLREYINKFGPDNDEIQKNLFFQILKKNSNRLEDLSLEEIKEVLLPHYLQACKEQLIRVNRNAMSKYKTGNCGEAANIIQSSLLERDIVAKQVRTEFTCGKTPKFFFNTHCFVLFGLDKNADLLIPKTWGNAAVAIDGWSKSAASAREFFENFTEYMKNKFGAELKNIKKWGDLEKIYDGKFTSEKL